MSRLRPLLQAIGLAPSKVREPLYKPVLHSLPTLIIVAGLILGLEHLGWLKGFETAALDGLLQAKLTRDSSTVVIVTVDDQDYRDLFGSKSPLDPDKLHELLTAIAAGKPAVIAIDFDTSAPQFAGRQWPEAVWARDADPAPEDAVQAPSHGAGHATEDLLRLPVLGGDAREELSNEHITTVPKSGLVIFPQDYDGVVRRYRRSFRSEHAEPPSDLTGEVDTLPWMVVKQYVATLRAAQAGPCAPCERIEKLKNTGHSHDLVLNFAGDRYRFNHIAARHVLAGAKQDFWSANSPLRNAIVLVGGAYRTARDEYVTPVGPMYGVELIAQAVESDLSGGGIRELNHVVAVLLEVATGLILVFLNWRFTGRFSAAISIVAIVCLSLFASYWAFNAFAYWFNFTAVLLAIWIHTLWDQAKERRELRHEVETLRSELAHQKAGTTA